MERSPAEPQDLWSMLTHQAARQPAKRAFRLLGSDLAERETLTYAELLGKSSARAKWLVERGLAGRRAVLPGANALDFVVNFFAVLAAGGAVAPLNPRLLVKPAEGLDNILDNIAPAYLLAGQVEAARLARHCSLEGRLHVEVYETSADVDDHGPLNPAIDPDATAVIQYTSGSTSEPKGVCVTHANFLANARMLRDTFDGGQHDVAVCWLPFFHDMGLMSGIVLPVVMGAASILLSPALFSGRPEVWLKALSKYGGTVSAAPDFAYRHCVDRVSDETAAALDLAAWRVAMCGAEPVRAATVEQFCRRFAASGFDPASFIPSYGLAEATLFVSGGPRRASPRIVEVDVDGLAQNLFKPPEDPGRGRRLVSCGAVAAGQQVLIVDPSSRQVADPATVGEIWLAGPGVGKGYFGKPELSDDIFSGRLAPTDKGHAEDPGRFLRTGDLGFLDGGELIVVGRLKDLIIVRGTKHHPQDIELSGSASHSALRHGRCVAFALEDGIEQGRVMVIHELPRDCLDDRSRIIAAVRGAVAEAHGLALDAVALVPAGSLPLTSSGKVRRRSTRDAWLARDIPTLAHWSARMG